MKNAPMIWKNVPNNGWETNLARAAVFACASARGINCTLRFTFHRFVQWTMHYVHSALRKSSANHIPIFGGSSGDYFKYETNYQLVNDRVSSDAIAVAFIETEILFGLGMSHGFFPTKRRVLVTRASGHVVHEFDHRPAAEVYAEMLDIPANRIRENLPVPPSPFNTFPFGSLDVYGNSLLHVPERILDDSSISFPHLIGNNVVMTLLRANE